MISEKKYELPQRDPNTIKKMFDAISFRYDLLNFLMSFGLDNGWRKRLVKESQLKENGKVLDLACGTGDITFSFYLSKIKGIEVMGTDFSPEMIKKAQKKAENKNILDIKFKVGDALKIDLPDNSVDVISIGFALRNLSDLPLAFKEMARVLKPGGRALCLDLTRPEGNFLKFGHSIFLRTYVPIVGFLFSGDFKAYSYLARSIREFPPAKIILKTMDENGFSKSQKVVLSGGIATIFVGEVAK
jgi:demethylmenaquinone methyltransferase/2-methoxy-6-polyprenyl-1,4-benzoquinol methylase